MIIFKKQNNSLDSKISKIFENLNYVIVEDKYEDQLENINYFKYDDSVGHPLSLNHDLFNKSIMPLSLSANSLALVKPFTVTTFSYGTLCNFLA